MDITNTIKIDLASLQSKGPLLREKILRPGDVLLVKGNTHFSSLIVSVTQGEYSHAAIWIPGGDEKVEGIFLAESDTRGVGFTVLMPMSLNTGNASGREIVFQIPDSPSKWILLRHPGCENIDSAKMHQASLDLQNDDFYKTYSAAPRLLETVTLRKSYYSLAYMVAQAIDVFRRDKGTRGVFCSELVAKFFSKLGLELFLDERESHTVSPNDLVLPECLLVEVENAFVDTQSLPPETYAYGSLSQKRKNDPFLRNMIKQRGMNDEITKIVDEFEGNLRNTNCAIIEQYNGIAEETQRRVVKQIALAELWNEPEQVEKLRRYAVMHKYGFLLLQCINEHDDLQRFGNTQVEDIESWNEASATLHYIAIEIMSGVQHALLRNTILSDIRRVRKTYRDTSPRRLQLVKFRRFRTKMFKIWERKKYENHENLAFHKRSLMYGSLSEQADLYIHKIVQQAYKLLKEELVSNQTK